MTAVNIDPITKFPYGVIAANHVPFLYDQIITFGTNLSAAAAEAEVRRTVRDELSELDEMPEGLELDDRNTYCYAAATALSKALDGSPGLTAIIFSLFDVESGTIDIGEAETQVLEYLNDRGVLCGDGEDDYTYTDGEMSYILGYLGGAPLIWVAKSPYITWASRCSPCVPNAGDLDNVRPFEEGQACLSLPPDAYPADNLPYLIRKIDDVGLVVEPMEEWRPRMKEPAHE